MITTTYGRHEDIIKNGDFLHSSFNVQAIDLNMIKAETLNE